MPTYLSLCLATMLLAACGGADDAAADGQAADSGPGGGDASPGDAAIGPDGNPGMCDDFERPVLGNDWMLWASSQCAIVNGSDLGPPDPSKWCYAVYGTTFGGDQFSEAVISDEKPAQILTQVFVRQQPFGQPDGNGARYGFHYNADPGKAWWEIKYDGVSSGNTRVWMNADEPAPVPGDTIRIEVRGSDPVVLTGYHNGRAILSIEDGESERIPATGHSGLVERNAGDSPLPPPDSPVFESWCGGDL